MRRQQQAEAPRRGARDSTLAIGLSILFAIMAWVYLVFVTGGFFFYVVLIAGLLGLVMSVHYLVWGRRFLADLERERVEWELERDAELATKDRHPWEQRY